MTTNIHAVIGVNISMGNAAVQTAGDVASLLEQAAEAVRARGVANIEHRSIALMDDNGNQVGTIQVTGYSETEEDY